MIHTSYFLPSFLSDQLQFLQTRNHNRVISFQFVAIDHPKLIVISQTFYFGLLWIETIFQIKTKVLKS